MDGQCVNDFFRFQKEPSFGEQRDDFFSCRKGFHAPKKRNAAVDGSVGQNNFAVGKSVLFRPFSVGAVAEGSAHYDAGSLVHADFFVGHDGNLIIVKRNKGGFSDIFPIPPVLRVDKQADASVEKLGAGGGNQNGFIFRYKREVVEGGFHIPGVKLRLRDGGLAVFAPENGRLSGICLALFYQIQK